MTMEEYYGAALPSLQEAIGRLLEIIGQYPASGRGTEEPSGEILYVRSRLKSPESLMAKLKKHGLPLDCASSGRCTISWKSAWFVPLWRMCTGSAAGSQTDRSFPSARSRITLLIQSPTVTGAAI